MPTTAESPPERVTDDRRRAAYLALVPTVRGVVRRAVRHVPCPDRRDDLVAEAVALGWRWYTRLVARGRDPAAFPVAFAVALGKSVRSGRRLARGDAARDVLSPVCRFRHGVRVCPLPADRAGAGYAHAAASLRTPVPDQVQFRIDFPRWRASLPPGRRRVLDLLAAGTSTQETATRVGVSPARVSQLRRVLRDGWRAFCGDAPTPTTEGVRPC